MNWTDDRKLETLTFGNGDPMITAEMRTRFKNLGVEIAEDIGNLGCTGVFAGLATGHDAARCIEVARDMRAKMGGAGIGLTCFVPPDRFCLVHNTIGGLEKGQMCNHAAVIGAISRELTDAERGHVQYVEAARRTRGKNTTDRMLTTMDQLMGDLLPAGVEPVMESEPEELEFNSHAGQVVESESDFEPTNGTTSERLMAQALHANAIPAVAPDDNVFSGTWLATLMQSLAFAVKSGAHGTSLDKLFVGLPDDIAIRLRAIVDLASERVREPNWKCPEHHQTKWECERCVASLVANGPYVPQLLLASGANPGYVELPTICTLADTEKTLEQNLKEFDDAEVAQTVAVFVRVKTWRRKLTPDS